MDRKVFKQSVAIALVGLMATAALLAPAQAGAMTDELTVTQLAKLTASDGLSEDFFGVETAIDADTAVAGAVYADIAGKSDQGAAYVYYRNLGGPEAWGEKVKLIAADGAAVDKFGRSIAIDIDTIAVGAYGADVSGKADQGAAYLFERNAGGADAWGQVKKITAADGSAGDNFGISVALDGDVLAVGAAYANISGKSGQGAVYIFYRNLGGANNWGQAAKIIASDGSANDVFHQVDLNGDVLVVGANGKNSERGAAYVFYRNQGGNDAWGEVKKLVASDGAAYDRFGASVSVSGEFIVSGAYQADPGGAVEQGAAYVYQRDAGGDDQWGQVKKVLASDGAADARFGVEVMIDNETLLVGAQTASPGGVYRAGAAYAYLRHYGGNNAWGEAAKITVSGGLSDDQFGYSASLDGETALVGAIAADVGGVYNQGAAYVFSLETLPLYQSFKQADPGAARPGEVVNFTISLNNSSDAEVSDVAMTDTLPQLLAYVDGTLTASKGQADYQNGVITWSGALAPQETVTITFEATISQSAPINQAIINTAQILGGGETIERSASVMVEPYWIACPIIQRPCSALYSDDFSNSGSGWPVEDDGNVLVGYDYGEYRILVRPSEWGTLVRPGFQAADYSVAVDLRNLNNVWGSYGIVFGLASDWSTFYTLEIYPDGWYGLYRWDPSDIVILSEAYSPAIQQGSATNHIKIERNGASIKAYANGQLLANVIDSTYMGMRYLGVVAFTYDQANLDVRYDNFTVFPISCLGANSPVITPNNGVVSLEQQIINFHPIENWHVNSQP